MEKIKVCMVCLLNSCILDTTLFSQVDYINPFMPSAP